MADAAGVPPQRHWIAGLCLLALLGVYALVGWWPSLALDAAGPRGTPTPAEPPLALAGTGTTPSPPFRLRGGTYALDWKASSPSAEGDECAVAVEIIGDMPFYQLLIQDWLEGGSTREGQTHLRRVFPGRYGISTAGSCNWAVRLRLETPLDR